MSRRVKLTGYEMTIAAVAGCIRHIASLQAGRKDKHGAEPNGWQLHIEGALGELAAAKATGAYWSGSVNTFKDADLGRNVQVRTRSLHHYELLVRDCDGDDDVFILVTGVAPNYVVHGWLYGREAKREDWLAGHGGREPAYFAPHQALRPIEDLPMTRQP